MLECFVDADEVTFSSRPELSVRPAKLTWDLCLRFVSRLG